MSLKIYFGCSIAGGRSGNDAAVYTQIVNTLKQYGTVLTEIVVDNNIEKMDIEANPKEVHDRDLEMLKQSDVMVTEVTQPSLGVGYEIAQAIHHKVPVLCLFRPDSGKRLSCMIDGAADGKAITVARYKDPEYTTVLAEFFANFKKSQGQTNGDGDVAA